MISTPTAHHRDYGLNIHSVMFLHSALKTRERRHLAWASICVLGTLMLLAYMSTTLESLGQSLRTSKTDSEPHRLPGKGSAGIGAGEEQSLDSTPPTHAPSTSPRLTVAEIYDLVSSTKGFLARDYDLVLGWNNMRYIIEAALLQAKLLDRTLILPSYVYARACEYKVAVCADYAQMVNRGDAVGSNEWRDLPLEQQMAWKIPIELMINITHLRESQPVITTADYLRLHGQNPETEDTTGKWTQELYHVRPNLITGRIPSLATIKNSQYDPPHIVRVDEITDELKRRANESVEDPAVEQALYAALPAKKLVLPWDKAQSALDIWSDISLEEAVVNNGWAVLYTYASIGGLDLNRGVIKPIKQIAPISVLRGFKDEHGPKAATVVLSQGAQHIGKKPGSMYFTTRLAQDAYSSIVLYDMSRIDALYTLADRLISHMSDLNEGRLWMAAHVRRGDFVRYHWAMEATPQAHINRVKRRLDTGRDTLIRLHTRKLKTYDVPGNAPVDERLHSLDPPLPGDKFYVATDERDPKVLEVFRSAGAVTMDDLLTIEDRQSFGKSSIKDSYWALMITDVRAVVEQIVLSEAGYFYGHAMSSVPGGVVNMRAARGKDPRTSLID